MGKPMDIDELLNKLTRSGGSGGGGDNGSKKNDMTEQEQADQLLELLGTHTSPVDYKPGDFVRYRKEFRSGIRNGDRLHIVLEKLPSPISLPLEQDTAFSHVGTYKMDIVLGVTDAKDKGAVLKFYADSRLLELWPGGERLKPKIS